MAVTGTRVLSVASNRRRGRREVLGEMEQDGAEVVDERRTDRDHGDRGVHEIAFVVPGRGELVPHPPADADHVGRARAGVHQLVECVVVECGELAMRLDQRGLGGGVSGDGPEPSGCVGQHRAHRGREHGHGHRPPSRRRERGRAQQLREPVHGQERHRGDPDAGTGERPQCARAQQPARRHADVVRGHDHRHRCERVTCLRRRHRAM